MVVVTGFQVSVRCTGDRSLLSVRMINDSRKLITFLISAAQSQESDRLLTETDHHPIATGIDG